MSSGARKQANARRRCSVIIPVFNQAALTRRCLDLVLDRAPARVEQEVIVVDDGSTDATPGLLASYGDRIRVVTHAAPAGFGASTNDGAAAACGDYLVFLNNDTIPREGWLDALVAHAESAPRAGAVGAKLLYPDGSVQHAGVVISQDGYPRHLYAGFPGDHPAVNTTRRFQAVTAACMLVRRDAFAAAAGFDSGYVNGYEDVDFCLRLGELGFEVHYCHLAEVVHLESMSAGRLSQMDENARRYYARWGEQVARDDLRYWSEDGLFRLDYWESYPVRARISPLVLALETDERGRELDDVLASRSRSLFRLRRRTIRLDAAATAHEEALELARAELAELGRERERELAEMRRQLVDLRAGSAATAKRQLEELAEVRADLADLRTGAAAVEEQRRGELAASRRDLGELRSGLAQIGRQLSELQGLREGLDELRAAGGRAQALLQHLAASEGEQRRLHAALEQGVVERADELEATLDEVHEALDRSSGLRPEEVAYRALVRRVKHLVRQTVPDGATVAVVSKGDNALTRLSGRTGWHFPRANDGVYAGYYPYNALAAVAQLESVRARGAQYLVLPSTGLWWLERYPEFGRHLQTRYPEAVRDEETCVIWSLAEPTATSEGLLRGVQAVVEECQARLDRSPAILDWDSGLGLARAFPHLDVLSAAANGGLLAYVDESVDVVAVGSSASVSEAARVAKQAVITLSRGRPTDDPGVEVSWKKNGSTPRLPSTSIVIPVHDQLHHTESCLRSLRETLPAGFDGEVILVDDASSAPCAARLAELAAGDERFRLLRNRRNLGFVGSTNRGAKAARCELLLFLNNDTILLPGWLPPLLRVLRDRPDAGVVGGRLLFEDGRLQEAGGVVFRDGSAANYGRGDVKLDDPLYTYVREVDYCSGALFATRRHLFEELGGFDERFSPGYYEDGDYCFGVRALGYRVYYQPAAAIVHFEGGTGGTDLTRGPKRYQVTNRATIVEKWRDALALQPVRPDDADLAAWRALALRDASTP